jgi:sugar phosphate isomerase/epimerase
MALARRVGLGFASRGKVSDAVGWAERARAAGLESVWFHDSYFERDAVTYASAVASQVEDIGIGLGALNPFTRHPVLIAMTVSSLDEAAELVDEAGADAGLMYDVWHLWREPVEQIARHRDRIYGVHVADWRDPTSNTNDRVLPGDGIVDYAPILDALRWDGLFDLEIFSDPELPDSLWNDDPRELARRGIAQLHEVLSASD